MFRRLMVLACLALAVIRSDPAWEEAALRSARECAVHVGALLERNAPWLPTTHTYHRLKEMPR